MTVSATAVFETYSEAGAVVRELELLGISGEQVEVVNDAGRDVRGEGYVTPPEHRHENELNPEVTMIIVRAGDELAFEQAKAIMQNHGAKVWQMAGGPSKSPTPPQPPLPPKPTDPPLGPASEGSRGAGLGRPGTTSHDLTDLEGRGKAIDVHNPGAPGEKETGPPPDPDRPPN